MSDPPIPPSLERALMNLPDPPPLPQHVPSELDRLVRAALARSPADRPQSLEELAAGLKPWARA